MMNQRKSTCVYDDWFSIETPEIMRESIIDEQDGCFESVFKFIERNYSSTLPSHDLERLQRIRVEGNAALKLVEILFCIVHEQAIHDQIIADCTDVEVILKIRIYRRLLSIVVRSLLETPFCEKTSITLVGRFLYLCELGWYAMDAKSLENFCDFFGARPEIEYGINLPLPSLQLASLPELQQIACKMKRDIIHT